MAQRASPRSPNVRFGSRSDVYQQQSPASRRASDNYANWSRNAGSPNTPREGTVYRPNDYTLERTHSVGTKIDFSGLRDVPTGPRRSISEINTPCISEINAPCIFISVRYMPKEQSMMRHLNRMLGNLRPDDIVIDDDGWNLIYDDSPAGHKRLTRCHERFHRELLFNQYELFMQCFPNGKPPRPRHGVDFLVKGRADRSSGFFHSPHQHLSDMPPTKFAGFEGPQTAHPKPIKSLGTRDVVPSSTPVETSAHALTTSQALSRDFFGHSSEGPHPHEHVLTGLNASQLSLRSDRDETGSIASGVTPSDSSRTVKRDKCHRCSGDAPPGASKLVRCSTCPRQYHRRCHQDPVIPAHLVDDHTWRCARCVKKGRTQKETPKLDTSKTSSKLEQSTRKADDLLGRSNHEEQAEQSSGHAPVAMETNDAPNVEAEVFRSDSKSPQNESDSHAEMKSNAKPCATEDDPLLSDADALVAQSFAAAEDQPHSKARPQKPGKLKITRTKLTPKPPHTETRQPQREKTVDQDATPMADSPAVQSSNHVEPAEPVARNSVADLRALAHDRHQMAIKSGTEGHFVSEEQRVRHVSSSDTARSSLAQQSSNECRLPQQPEKSAISSIPPSSSKHTSEREIPESPDEVRRGGLARETMASDPRLLARLNSAVSQPHTERASAASPMQTEKPSAGPRGPSAVDRCSMCEKKIPQGPSRGNKLCSGCRKKVAAAAEAKSVEAKIAPLTSASPVHKSVVPVANMGACPQKTSGRADLGDHGIENAVNDQNKGATPQPNDRPVRIDKGLVGAPAKAANSVEPTPKTTKVDGDGDTQMQGALSQEPKRDDAIINPLAIQILGELQFSPTVQMQLREDPFMSEFKIHQLKRILMEIETARTDEKVLASGLAAAIATIKNGSLPPEQALNSPNTANIGNTDPTGNDAIHDGVPNKRLKFIKSVVGDSSDRPVGSRLILVAMALGSIATHRMQANHIMEWIANTVPTYKKGEGNWASRISAMLSQGRLTDSGGGYWREEDWQEGDGGKPKGRWYQLLPEKMDEMWTWCPVLKEPLSPQSRRDARARKATQTPAVKQVQRASGSLQSSAATSTSAPVTPMSNTSGSVSIYCSSFVMEDDGKRVKSTATETTRDDDMGIDEEGPKTTRGKKRKQQSFPEASDPFTPEKRDSSSDDDEPLSARAKRRRGETLSQDRTTKLRMVQHHTPISKEVEGLEADATAAQSAARRDAVNRAAVNSNIAFTTSDNRAKSGPVTLRLNGTRKSSLAGLSNREATVEHEHLATSLYKEWPEFLQQASDEHDKLAEISKRPKKKQVFGRPASNAHLQHHKPLSGPATIPSNMSPEKRSRTMTDPTPDDLWPWENPEVDHTRKECKSLEEFFDFPQNMIPIISEGQLAYRDGTRTDDGRLPRAREIFKP
jgi:hypothetical protein